MYLAKWRSAEVAIKCLNASSYLPDGGLGSAPDEAVAELLKEAALLGSLRHPNVVWVYGIVLSAAAIQRMAQAKGAAARDEAIDAVSLAAAAPCDPPLLPGMMRTPALVTEYMAGEQRGPF